MFHISFEKLQGHLRTHVNADSQPPPQSLPADWGAGSWNGFLPSAQVSRMQVVSDPLAQHPGPWAVIPPLPLLSGQNAAADGESLLGREQAWLFSGGGTGLVWNTWRMFLLGDRGSL